MAPARADCIGAKNSASNMACRCRRTNRGRSRKTTGRRRGPSQEIPNLANTSRSNARFLANVTTTDEPSARLPARPARCMWLARPGGTFPSTTPFNPPMSMPSSIVVVDDKRFRAPSLNRNCLRLFSCRAKLGGMLLTPKAHGKNGGLAKLPPGAAPAAVLVGFSVGNLMKSGRDSPSAAPSRE